MFVQASANARRMGGRVASMSGLNLGPMWILVGIAIGLAVVGVVAALSLLPTGVSAGLISASSQIAAFLGLIGLGIAVGLMTNAFGRRR